MQTVTTTQHTTTEAAENARALILQAFRPQGNTIIEVGGQQLALVVEKVIGNSLIGWLWDDDEDVTVGRVVITVEGGVA